MSVARWLETDSLSNQNIASAAAIGAYTADADRMVVVDVSLDQVAGNGDYVIYVTRQINGAGSAYVLLPKTTCAAASGETAIAMQSGPITVRSGDVLTVMVDGLAGDTATPDTTVRWFEMATLRPATADRQLTVAATGEASANVTHHAGVAVAAADLNGNVPVIVKAWYDTLVPEPGTAGYPDVGTVSNISLQVSQQVRDAMKLAPSGGAVAAGSVDAELAALPTAAENAYAVWNENMADHLGPTTTGGRLDLASQAGPVGDMIEAVGYKRFKTTALENMPAAVGLATANLDAQLAGLPTAADVQAAATAALEAYDPPTMAELTSAVAPLALEATVGALPTAAENADAVLDELLSGHTIPGSAGAGIAAAGTADDPWITVLPGSYNSGTAGAIIGALAAIDTTAVTITPANNAGHLTITAARTFEATISGLTIPANWVTALWTLKTDDSRPDVAALVQLRETNPAALSDGLQRLNGAALPSGVTAAAGSLTVNQAGGSVVVWLSDEVTARLGKATGIGWDVKFIDAAGDSDGADGTADVALTETKATA